MSLPPLDPPSLLPILSSAAMPGSSDSAPLLMESVRSTYFNFMESLSSCRSAAAAAQQQQQQQQQTSSSDEIDESGMSASFVQHVRCLSVLIKASGCGRPKTAALLHTKMYLKHSVYLRQSVAQRNQTQTPPIAFDLQFLCKVWKYYLNCRDCRVAAVEAYCRGKGWTEDLANEILGTRESVSSRACIVNCEL